jgi:hypothetical protein
MANVTAIRPDQAQSIAGNATAWVKQNRALCALVIAGAIGLYLMHRFGKHGEEGGAAQ